MYSKLIMVCKCAPHGLISADAQFKLGASDLDEAADAQSCPLHKMQCIYWLFILYISMFIYFCIDMNLIMLSDDVPIMIFLCVG
jgi:hypothetical protein